MAGRETGKEEEEEEAEEGEEEKGGENFNKEIFEISQSLTLKGFLGVTFLFEIFL